MALPEIKIVNGTLVADPELKYTNSGKAVVNFRVATNSRRKNEQTGQWENADSTFLNVSSFDGLAENIVNKFQKGSKINVIGTLKQREYEKDGQKRTVYDVTSNDVSEPISRFNDGNQGQPPQSSMNNAQNAAQDVFGSMDQPPF